jgi:hypothetical protein
MDAEAIFSDFLSHESEQQVNLPSSLLSTTRHRLDEAGSVLRRYGYGSAADGRALSAATGAAVNSRKSTAAALATAVAASRKRATLAAVQDALLKNLSSVFDEPQVQIFSLMCRDSFPRFKRDLADRQRTERQLEMGMHTIDRAERMFRSAYRKHRVGMVSEEELLQIVALDAKVAAQQGPDGASEGGEGRGAGRGAGRGKGV